MMINMYKIIQDTINGPIKIDGIYNDIIDSYYFQRLRYVKQLGLCYLVFPGANHTRFEHSIGTMFMAREISNSLKIDNEKLQLAALLHDIGHPPFSHGIEDVFYDLYKIKHEDLTLKIIKGEKPYDDSNIPDILKKYGYDPEEIGEISIGKSRKNELLSNIISGPIDVDEIDYLRRDAFFCGVTIGNIDYKRIFNTIKIEDNKIVGEEKSITNIESAIITRILMYNSVYFHKTCRIAQKMLGYAYYNNDDKNIYDLKLNDFEFINKLLNGKSKDMVKNILKRNLYKIVYNNYYSINNYNEILNKLNNFDKYDYIMDIIPPLYFSGKDRVKNYIEVYYNNKKYKINKLSSIANSLYKEVEKRKLIISADNNIYNDIKNII